MAYSHTQTSPLGWLLLVVAAGLCSAGAVLWNVPGAFVAILVGAVLTILAAAFWRLRVEDRGTHLSVRYGPLPIFGTRVDYSSVQRFEQGRTALIDGWGIHIVPGRGWTYNLWGRDCIILHRPGSIIRIGTDDPEGLAAFLESRVGRPQERLANA